MRHDSLADMFCTIKNMEIIGRPECEVPVSKLIKGVLDIVKKNGYIKDFKLVKTNQVQKYHISLHGKINNCNVVRPHFSVKVDDFIKWEKRFLPARETGTLILTTSKGIMDQKDAVKQNTGGRILGFVY